jgi:hypothetical protein
MQPHNEPSILITFLPMIVMSVFIGIGSFLLAKDKGRNALKWTILGSIPLVNLACVWYFVGATNLRLERKIDDLLSSVESIKNRN